jgi:epoxyqueuosine reductase
VLTHEVLERARARGFAAVGVAPALPSAQGDAVLRWLAQGAHGSMAFLERDIALRLDPRGHLSGTRAFLMVADAYASRDAANSTRDADEREAQPSGGIAPGRVGKIARYARGRDYHATMKKRLHALADELRAAYPGCDFRSFVDTAPVLEREVAMLAGLGWQAKNTMLIHPRLGSYLVLGGFATTLPLEVTPDESRVSDACGTCTRCIDACPTGAITPYRVDASRCVSYLTIERELPIDPVLHEGVGSWIYGCDVCQEVCPHNSPRSYEGVRGAGGSAAAGSGRGLTGAMGAAYSSTRASFDLLDVMRWDEGARRRAFVNSAMKRAPLAVMRRNAIIAAANAVLARRDGEPAHDEATRVLLREAIARIAADPQEAEMVRATAAESLARIVAGEGRQGS